MVLSVVTLTEYLTQMLISQTSKILQANAQGNLISRICLNQPNSSLMGQDPGGHSAQSSNKRHDGSKPLPSGTKRDPTSAISVTTGDKQHEEGAQPKGWDSQEPVLSMRILTSTSQTYPACRPPSMDSKLNPELGKPS
jgi:hypothetical protein